MDESIKSSIKTRRSVFTDYYVVKDKKLLDQIDNLFKKIEKLGLESKDVMDFENKFMASDMNKEYTDLLSSVAISSQMKTIKKDIAEASKVDPKEVVKNKMDSLRRRAKRNAEYELRGTPIGDLIQISKNLKN